MSSTVTANLGHPFGFLATLTSIHLILIALLAVTVIAGVLHGVRLQRRRSRALAQEQERLDAYAAEHPGAPAAPVRPPVPTEPVTTSAGQEEQRPPVPAPPSPPADPLDGQVPAAAAAAGDGTPAPEAAPPSALAPASGAPAPRADAAPADAADAGSGPVTQLKGLGPKVAARLAELGIISVGQIAALDDDAADALDARLGPFQGRIARDRWIEQARFLAAGDRAGFEAVFGRL